MNEPILQFFKKRFKLNDERIEELLAHKDYVNLLKRYRHATFHYREKYFDEEFLKLWREGEDAKMWVDSIHKEFKRYLEDWFDRSGQRDKATGVKPILS